MFGIKKQAQGKETTPQLPRAVIKTEDASVEAGPELTQLALEGWWLKKEIDSMTERLNTVNETILLGVEPGSTLLVDDVVQIPVARRETVKVLKPETLKRLLRGRYADLVTESISYTLTPKAKELAADADDPLGRELATCLAVSASVSLSYRGGKPLPKS